MGQLLLPLYPSDTRMINLTLGVREQSETVYYLLNGMAQWKQVCNTDATVPATNPKNKIDYIFVYPKDKWEIIENASYFTQLSDHLPISAVVEMK